MTRTEAERLTRVEDKLLVIQSDITEIKNILKSQDDKYVSRREYDAKNSAKPDGTDYTKIILYALGLVGTALGIVAVGIR